MPVTDIFMLYLFPWVLLLGVLLALGVASWLTELVFHVKPRRIFAIIAIVLLTPMACRFLEIGLSDAGLHEALPLSRQISLACYCGCGAVMAVISLIGIGALLSEQIDIAKRHFQAADQEKPL
jgi:hypothetical protein